MGRTRKSSSDLPAGVYERLGPRRYSIWYRPDTVAHRFRLSADADDPNAVARTRREAIEAALARSQPPPPGSISELISRWFTFQESLPLGSPGRRAESTLAENKFEAHRLDKVFGHMPLRDLRTRDAVLYLRAGATGGRPAKANKEIALLRRMLQFALEEGAIDQNPFVKITPNQTRPDPRLVKRQELATMLWAGRSLGGAPGRVALGLYVSMLCVRRSSELRAMRVSQITESGILWTASKQQATHMPMKVKISWSPRLRVAISHAKRLLPQNAGDDPALFGTRQGAPYTKGGWKATLAKLMRAAQALAAKRGTPFQPFNLQHMRPMGVTTKRQARHDDVLDATLHTSDRMVTRVYDRRAVKSAKPAA